MRYAALMLALLLCSCKPGSKDSAPEGAPTESEIAEVLAPTLAAALQVDGALVPAGEVTVVGFDKPKIVKHMLGTVAMYDVHGTATVQRRAVPAQFYKFDFVSSFARRENLNSKAVSLALASTDKWVAFAPGEELFASKWRRVEQDQGAADTAFVNQCTSDWMALIETGKEFGERAPDRGHVEGFCQCVVDKYPGELRERTHDRLWADADFTRYLTSECGLF